MEPTTLTNEVTLAQYQKPTPVKARIQGAIDFLESEGIKGRKSAVFRANGVSRRTGYRILQSSNPRTLKNDPTHKETRGRKQIMTPAQIREMEKNLENEGLEGRGLTWSQLGFEAQVDASEAPIKCVTGSLDYHKCLACQRGWQSPSSKKNRVEYANTCLNDILSLKIGIVSGSAMRYTSDGAHNTNYTLYESLRNDTV